MTVRGLNTLKLRDVAFTLCQGESLGLVCLVGAGRTEIVRALFGADKVRGHEVTIDGKTVEIRSPGQALRAGMALVPEDRKLQGLVLPFSVQSNISMANLKRLVPRVFLNAAREREMAERQIRNLSIKTPGALTRVESLSGGNQQK